MKDMAIPSWTASLDVGSRASLVTAPAAAGALVAIALSTVSLWSAQFFEGQSFLDGSPRYQTYVALVENLPALILTVGVGITILLTLAAVLTRKLPPICLMLLGAHVLIWLVAIAWIGFNSFSMS